MLNLSKETIKLAASGDEGAFGDIYRASAAYVHTIALRIAGNKEDAEEVTQDVFVSVHRNLWKFRFKSKFKTWLYRITVNRAINAYNKRSRNASRSAEFDDQRFASYDREIDKNDAKEEVERVLKVLSPDQRACLVLKEIDGMKYEEIAGTLGIKINTVKTRIKRAREKLMDIYGKGGGHEL